MAKTDVYGLTKDGIQVFPRVDTDAEHVHCSLVTLRQALEKIKLNGEKFSRHNVMFDYPVGKDRCVMRKPGDNIVRWKRPGRDGETPMVLNREAEPTNQLNVVICFDDEQLQEYVVITAFLGQEAPQEPWDKRVRDKEASEAFWAAHALVPTIEERVAMKKAGLI